MQTIVVISEDWEQAKGSLYRIENGTVIGEVIPVWLGKRGMGWGKGLHGEPPFPGPLKCEGDMKSPAGIFELGPVFGFDRLEDLKMPYLQLQPDTEWVDDPQSRFYNCSVNFSEIFQPDWNSSEKMRDIGIYELGMFVRHNADPVYKGAGSCIFFHIKGGEWTAGCTAMSKENLRELLYWIDMTKKPRLIQLPLEAYQRLQEAWQLPPLTMPLSLMPKAKVGATNHMI